jgi:hypothetical protein
MDQHQDPSDAGAPPIPGSGGTTVTTTPTGTATSSTPTTTTTTSAPTGSTSSGGPTTLDPQTSVIPSTVASVQTVLSASSGDTTPTGVAITSDGVGVVINVGASQPRRGRLAALAAWLRRIFTPVR